MNDFKTAKLDWQDILKDGISWIYYTYKERKKLSTSDGSQDIDGSHGRYTSPTFARTRIITLEGYVDRLGNTAEFDAVQYLENLFSLQGDLWSLDQRVLYIKDMYDNEWNINVKIKDPLEFLEWDDTMIGSHWRWRVVLESTETPIYKSINQILVTWEEGNFWGLTFPFSLSSAWNKVESVIECTTTGNIPADVKITITAINDIDAPLTILNVTNNTFFSLNISAVSWDIIIIDSINKVATKNGVSVIWNRVSGSIWPSVKATTKFVIEDLDWWIMSDDFDVSIYFYNSLL